MSRTKYLIEACTATGLPVGLALNVRTAKWESITVESNGFPTKQGAQAYLNEFGLLGQAKVSRHEFC